MNTKRTTLWVVVLLLALVACTANEGAPPASDNESVTPGDDTYQGEDPTEGEPDEGDAKGSQDETLEGLGGGYIYRREGGIAGFCDIVTVLAGTATVATCAADPPEIIGEVTLTNDQSQQVMTWIEQLATFDHEQSDPAVADAMTVTIIFQGEGDGEPTDDEIAAMETLALELLRAVGTQ